MGGGGWGLHSHFHVKPNRCVVLCCVGVGVLTICEQSEHGSFRSADIKVAHDCLKELDVQNSSSRMKYIMTMKLVKSPITASRARASLGSSFRHFCSPQAYLSQGNQLTYWVKTAKIKRLL